MCIIAFTAIYSTRRVAQPSPLAPSFLTCIFFSFRRNLGHMPRGTQSALIHSHLFSLAAISKASLYAQKWFAQTGPSKQLWQRPASLLWREMTDNRETVRGWRALCFNLFDLKTFFFKPTWLTKHRQTPQITSLKFLTKNILSCFLCNIFQLPRSPFGSKETIWS